MNFVFSLINFIGFLMYIVAILGVVKALGTYDTFKMKSEWKNTLLVFILVTIVPMCGYFIRDYAQGKKSLIHFNEIIDRKKGKIDNFTLMDVSLAFSRLDIKDKERAIQIIFNNFYNNSLVSRCSFLNKYKEYHIPFILKIKTETETELENLYINIERDDDHQQWRMLAKNVPIKDFLLNAPQSIVDREFTKWDKDDNAWQRVILLDSVYLSRFYLERYPNGQHEAAARKIILDNEYSKSEGRYRKISANYCGSTPVLIINNSSYEATFFYDGSFDKGSIRVPKNSRSNINLQNGYYRISINSQSPHTRGINERITCDGSCITYDLYLKRDY